MKIVIPSRNRNISKFFQKVSWYNQEIDVDMIMSQVGVKKFIKNLSPTPELDESSS